MATADVGTPSAFEMTRIASERETGIEIPVMTIVTAAEVTPGNQKVAARFCGKRDF
jgi:hypothetical protein